MGKGGSEDQIPKVVGFGACTGRRTERKRKGRRKREKKIRERGGGLRPGEKKKEEGAAWA